MTHRTQHRRRPDAGATLIEIVLTVVLAPIVVLALATAFTAMLRVLPESEERLERMHAVSLVEFWWPADIREADEVIVDADPTLLNQRLAGLSPAITLDASVAGTNVATIVDVGVASTNVYSYRYVQDAAGDWSLVRHSIIGYGAAPSQATTTLAYAVAPPPTGWVEGDATTHAVRVRPRGIDQGVSLDLTFVDGSTFTIGALPKADGEELDTTEPAYVAPTPSVPASRCGERIALVIDASGSVGDAGQEQVFRDAAASFAAQYRGTPTRLSVYAFSRMAWELAPTQTIDTSTTQVPWYDAGSVVQRTTDGLYTKTGTQPVYASMQDAAAVTDITNKIQGLNYDAWVEANPPITPHPNQYGPAGEATNWEDAIWAPVWDHNGAQWDTLPDRVVVVTDGQPTQPRRILPSSVQYTYAFFTSGSNEAFSEAGAVAGAATAATNARLAGVEVTGVLINPGASASEAANMTSVFGHDEWNGTDSTDPGNAADADWFQGDWADLGEILRTIALENCGGSITLAKKLDESGTVSPLNEGLWGYTTEVGETFIHPVTAPYAVVDYSFPSGTSTIVTEIRETPQDGFVWSRAECFDSSATPIPPSRINPLPDGEAGFSIEIQANEVVSCNMISVRA